MSKNIFINNLDTYVSQAIFKELRNDQLDEEGNKPDNANLIFGTYIGKDSSVNPEGVKKMLKVSTQPLQLDGAAAPKFNLLARRHQVLNHLFTQQSLMMSVLMCAAFEAQPGYDLHLKVRPDRLRLALGQPG